MGFGFRPNPIFCCLRTAYVGQNVGVSGLLYITLMLRQWLRDATRRQHSYHTGAATLPQVLLSLAAILPLACHRCATDSLRSSRAVSQLSRMRSSRRFTCDPPGNRTNAAGSHHRLHMGTTSGSKRVYTHLCPPRGRWNSTRRMAGRPLGTSDRDSSVSREARWLASYTFCSGIVRL